MFSLCRIHTYLGVASAILLWRSMSLARPHSNKLEASTSRSYFSRCGRGSSSSLERLSSAVPIKKILASFDIKKGTAFFRLESCSSYSICFITKTNVIKRKDFGAPSTVLWSKLVNQYQGKAPVAFKEADHRKIFSRTKLEDSCLHGFYVIGQSNKRSSGTQSDEKTSLPVSILTQARGTKKGNGKRKKSGRRKPRRNKPKRKRQRRKKLANRKRSAKNNCDTNNEFCVRRCIGWDSGDCIQLQISCSFLCPVKS